METLKSKTVAINLLKAVPLLFFVNAFWYQKFLLFGIIFFIYFTETTISEDKKYMLLYFFSCVLFIIVGFATYFIAPNLR
ncbi:hypothetical protein BJV85_003819 [Clostridium acetobutylicum]|uniref:Uncharacterized protein n=1 Tax=Clostridium acetobutylicum (strain ATCC 824 / DSM 792 / JCM 1419 / IAM 19013 / LMG 5710 / NBRC 13948 / NRRL B-527 / VKM B-1787 / 2291 / W) TaxID=272562 RepID=Q97TE9_CLOAB|nr:MULTISPECIES: hypothetical protein [Clostridium]AEI34896.1 hypothetical protein SMB_P153 [Clostridium acetobutylicum DSM 1731]AAK76900.1 Hypothetical protein CA_P0155 [Clostridium acetobutylicum ATCC 824]AWV82442.1 hypothetical protein DK921_20335 [Clostridium acetobutylicum]AWV82445.1 hypothetical protein DK921_20355 [Clostridium acetobutylicum]MBC2395714.1 hypothetical protein [Clostridium acetobutylicum]